MIELTEDNIYRVKNFAKHQNIKIKEKSKTKDDETGNLKITYKDINKIENNMSDDKINNNPHDNIPMLLEVKKNKPTNKKGKKRINIDEEVDEEAEDNRIVCFYDGDEGRPLGVDEHVEKVWSFNWLI